MDIARRKVGRVRNYAFDFQKHNSSQFKKNALKPWLKKEWCISPEKNAEFVFRWENVLNLYKQSYNPIEILASDQFDSTAQQEMLLV